MNVLPLGSVIRLKDGEQKIMIISRVPLYNNEGRCYWKMEMF